MRDSEHAARYSYVFNERFKGGFITRHYGAPESGIHAIQLEMSQVIYMNEHAPYNYVPNLAEIVQPLLRALLTTCLTWAKARHARENLL
jgi:N-formylglutamate deformylase